MGVTWGHGFCEIIGGFINGQVVICGLRVVGVLWDWECVL